MRDLLASVKTRFRVYQLENAGSLMSYATPKNFTLIEARIGETSRKNLKEELEIFNKEYIDTLHITSWDRDHCNKSELDEILRDFKPSKIEYPGYEPHCQQAVDCLNLILAYQKSINFYNIEVIEVTPEYIGSLDKTSELGYKNIFYHPKWISENNSNDNSTVKLFRTGSFNVLSLGDIEDSNIGSSLRNSDILSKEVDILVLAHHGANCDTNSKTFFKYIRPKLTICTSNFGNQYDHPHPDVRARLNYLDIPVHTSKNGDIIIESINNHKKKYLVTDYIGGSCTDENIRAKNEYSSKKSIFLSYNLDTIRDQYNR